MRNSDWSSDVCSSDLAPLRALCERMKVPTAHRELALMACREHLNVHRLHELRDPTVHDLLARCDAFRKPDRIAQLAIACEAHKPGPAGLQAEPYPPRAYLSEPGPITRLLGARHA